jgi:uncharacterized protein YggE
MNARAPFVALLLGLVVGPAASADPAKPVGKKVTVTGTATVNVKPDSARLVFGITTTTPDVKSTRSENDKHVKRMKESLAALGFKDVDFQAVPGSVSSVQTNEAGAAAGGVQTKQVQTVITVTVHEKDADKLRTMVTKLSDTATENGAAAAGSDEFSPFIGGRGGRMGRGIMEVNQGPQIEWLTHEMGDARREAIKKAVKDAHANALAAVPDAKLEVVEVIVNNNGGEGGPRARYRGGPYGYIMDSTPTSVTVEVQVTFSY